MAKPTIERELAKLRARVGVIEDIEEIRRLRMLYHHYVNIGAFHRVADLYTDDANSSWATSPRAGGGPRSPPFSTASAGRWS